MSPTCSTAPKCSARHIRTIDSPIHSAISCSERKKLTGASEILPRRIRSWPRCRRCARAALRASIIKVLNVQAQYTKQQIDAVWHTLAQGIALTGIVMLLFLRSWRNAIVVLIAIPASLLVAFARS